jgi:hypothetical protein
MIGSMARPEGVSMADAHEQTLAHLRLLAGLPGYWELRALRRQARQGNRPCLTRSL